MQEIVVNEAFQSISFSQICLAFRKAMTWKKHDGSHMIQTVKMQISPLKNNLCNYGEKNVAFVFTPMKQ